MEVNEHKAELKNVNLRATPARLTILKLLGRTKKPIDINMAIDFLKKEGIKTNPATVFRTMNVLTQKGVTLLIQLQEGKMRYELSDREHHHHLVCEICGNIEDVLVDDISRMEKKIRRKTGFLVKRHSLEFFGLCKNCQN
jgi:Fur family transcriptional regulator, ferric uptake regulator